MCHAQRAIVEHAKCVVGFKRPASRIGYSGKPQVISYYSGRGWYTLGRVRRGNRAGGKSAVCHDRGRSPQGTLAAHAGTAERSGGAHAPIPGIDRDVSLVESLAASNHRRHSRVRGECRSPRIRQPSIQRLEGQRRLAPLRVRLVDLFQRRRLGQVLVTPGDEQAIGILQNLVGIRRGGDLVSQHVMQGDHRNSEFRA